MPLLQNVGVFGTRTRSNALLVTHMLGASHASELSAVLGVSLSQAQLAIDSLERAGLLVGAMEGSARRVRLNPRFPAKDELSALLDKLALVSPELQDRLAEIRRRPRRGRKPL